MVYIFKWIHLFLNIIQWDEADVVTLVGINIYFLEITQVYIQDCTTLNISDHIISRIMFITHIRNWGYQNCINNFSLTSHYFLSLCTASIELCYFEVQYVLNPRSSDNLPLTNNFPTINALDIWLGFTIYDCMFVCISIHQTTKKYTLSLSLLIEFISLVTFHRIIRKKRNLLKKSQIELKIKLIYFFWSWKYSSQYNAKYDWASTKEDSSSETTFPHRDLVKHETIPSFPQVDFI